MNAHKKAVSCRAIGTPLLGFKNTIKHSASLHPTSRTLAVDVHGDRAKCDSDSSSTNNIKRIPHTLYRDPVIGVERQAECEKVLDEVHDGESFGGLLAMAVGDVGDDGGSSQLNTQVDQTHADDDWDGPRIAIVE